MDRKGGCCIARYAGNAYDLSRMDRIMLRFRPIAPKPAENSSCSGKSDVEMSNPSVEKGRGKRRYVRNRKKRNDNSSDGSRVSVTKGCKFKKNGRKKKSLSPEENESDGRGMDWFSVGDKERVVTLPLLPETPGATKDYSAKEGFFSGMEKSPSSLSFGSEEYFWRVGGVGVGGGGFWMDKAVAPVKKVVGTWVNVECITGTWVDGYGYGGIGLTDEEKLMSLERDACPGFVSDGSDRVVWVNRAYKEMVVGGGGGEEAEEEVLVWLVMKEGLQLPPKSWPGFTCSVGVVTCGKAKSSRTLPCDVWRLEGGHGFAWRLDIKTALSL